MARISAQIGLWLGVIGLVLILVALGLGRLLPEGELYVYTLPWKSQPAVYLMDIRRAVSVAVTKNLPPADAYRLAALSPDSNQIMVTAAVPAGSVLSLLDIWRGALKPLLIQSAYDDQAAWSPDSRWIAFTALHDGVSNIFITQVGSGTSQRLTKPPDSTTQPSWSPDGEHLAYVEGQRLFVMAVDCPAMDGICGRNAQPLTSSAGVDSFPTWSPDGTQIAFMSNRSGRAEIYVMDVACLDSETGCLQQNPRQLTRGLGRLHTLSWSAADGLLGFITDIRGRAGLYALQPDCDLISQGCVFEPLVIVEP